MVHEKSLHSFLHTNFCNERSGGDFAFQSVLIPMWLNRLCMCIAMARHNYVKTSRFSFPENARNAESEEVVHFAKTKNMIHKGISTTTLRTAQRSAPLRERMLMMSDEPIPQKKGSVQTHRTCDP